MNKYKVPATMYTYLYLEVLAESADEALAIARETDGSEFIARDGSGEWEVAEPTLIEKDIEGDEEIER